MQGQQCVWDDKRMPQSRSAFKGNAPCHVYVFMFAHTHTDTQLVHTHARTNRMLKVSLQWIELSVPQLLQLDSSCNLELTEHCTDQNKRSIPTEEDATITTGIIPTAAGAQSQRGQQCLFWPQWIINLSQNPFNPSACLFPSLCPPPLTFYSPLVSLVTVLHPLKDNRAFLFHTFILIQIYIPLNFCLFLATAPQHTGSVLSIQLLPSSLSLSPAPIFSCSALRFSFLSSHMDGKVGQNWPVFEMQDEIRMEW